MGRVKTIAIKSMAREILNENGALFSEDFEKNKQALSKVRPIKSKRIRNIIAGYLASEMKKVKKSGV